MVQIHKPKVVVSVPTTPQEAADLARAYAIIDEQRADIQKLRDAQNGALKQYIKSCVGSETGSEPSDELSDEEY